MKRLLLLTLTLLLTACGGASEQTPSNGADKQARGEATAGQSSGVDVKVTKNGKSLVAFQSASNNTGVGAMLTGKDVSIEITSPDQKWVLSISVSGAKAGAYRLAGTRENGKAMILLTGGDDAMMVRASAGELNLSELSESYCSGTFKGTGTDATGNKYTYEGKFSRIEAFRQD